MSGGQTGHMLAARPRADNDDAGGGPPHSKIETTLMCVDELRVEELAEVLERIAERRVTSVADLDNDRQTATPTRRNRRDGPGRSRTSALRRPAEDADPAGARWVTRPETCSAVRCTPRARRATASCEATCPSKHAAASAQARERVRSSRKLPLRDGRRHVDFPALNRSQDADSTTERDHPQPIFEDATIRSDTAPRGDRAWEG
jgi:hypothetical protein